MKPGPRIGPRLAACLRIGATLAGLALGLKAVVELDAGKLGGGLREAGWALYLMLLPHGDLVAYRVLLRMSIGGAAAREVGRRVMPVSFRLVTLFASACLIAGLLLDMRAALR